MDGFERVQFLAGKDSALSFLGRPNAVCGFIFPMDVHPNKYDAMQKKLFLIIRRCRINQEEAQEELYDMFFGYAESVSARYTSDKVEQLEIIDLGFKKVYKYICHFDTDSKNLLQEFQEWIKKMMVYAAVGYLRNKCKLSCFLNFGPEDIRQNMKGPRGKNGYSACAIRTAILGLPSSARLVMNLTNIQGLNEKELAECLGISREKAHALHDEVTTKFYGLLSGSVPTK